MNSWDVLRGKLAKMAEERGFQADLARRMKVPPALIGRYLKNERTPGLDQLDKFAEALGQDPWALIRPEGAVDRAAPEADLLAIIRAALDATPGQREALRAVLKLNGSAAPVSQSEG